MLPLAIHSAPMRLLPLLCVPLFVFALAGCDVFGVNDSLAYGRVVDAESGEPLAGVHVSFASISGGFPTLYITEAFTTTGTGGEYELFYEGDENIIMRVNSLGYGGGGCILLTHTSSPLLDYFSRGMDKRIDVDLIRNPYYNPDYYPSPTRCT